VHTLRSSPVGLLAAVANSPAATSETNPVSEEPATAVSQGDTHRVFVNATSREAAQQLEKPFESERIGAD
jgi:hypothetical protein